MKYINATEDTINSAYKLFNKTVDFKFIKSYDEILSYEEDNKIYTEEKAANISFEDIIYTYPQAKRYALKNLKLML